MNSNDRDDAMHTNTEHPSSLPQRDPLATLLAQAGHRPAPPARMEAEVRAAVHAEWQHLLAMKKARRQKQWLALAAMVAIGSGIWLARAGLYQPVVSTMAISIGAFEETPADTTLNAQPITNANSIHSGDALRTGATGARIRLNSGITLRIAAHTQLQWRTEKQLQLTQGSVYIDSHANAAALTVTTPQGAVTHRGTRYLIATENNNLRIAVRAGQASLHTGNTQLTIDANQQVLVTANRQIVRSDLRLDDPDWQWTLALADPFVLENHTVAQFLQWVTDETGYELKYDHRAIATGVAHTLLHGPALHMTPLQALPAVLATTDFQAVIHGGQLRVTQAH